MADDSKEAGRLASDGMSSDARTQIAVIGEGAPVEHAGFGKEPGQIRKLAALAVLSVLALFAVIILPGGLFQQNFGSWSLAQFVDQLMSNVRDLAATVAHTGAAGVFSRVVCSYAVAFVAGAALGCCGAVFQGSFRNPLASPSTVGVVSGCLLGAVVYVLFFQIDHFQSSTLTASEIMQLYADMSPLEYAWSVYGRALCALVGGMAVVAIAMAISRAMGGGTLNNVVIVVIGQVFTLVIASLCDAVRYYFESSGDYERGELVQTAQAVPFSAFFDFDDLAWFAVPLLVGLVVLIAMRTRLNLLSFSDADARSMGVDVNRFRTSAIVLCTAMTSLVVGFCGPVVFVGFVCPHIARRIVGSNFRYLLPASLLIGAMFLLIVLFVVNQFSIDAYQGVNLVATAVGCVTFLVVAFRGKGGVNAWR